MSQNRRSDTGAGELSLGRVFRSLGGFVELLSFEVKGDVLDLSAAHGDRKYRKEVVLPAVRAT
jgi:hypothetical protein